ncbi:MAG: carbohydrate ABC transporter permease, partial [Acidimicrobiales bacterium]
TDYSGLMAGSVLYTLPVVILFVLVQRKVVAGLAAGAVKG